MVQMTGRMSRPRNLAFAFRVIPGWKDSCDKHVQLTSGLLRGPVEQDRQLGNSAAGHYERLGDPAHINR